MPNQILIPFAIACAIVSWTVAIDRKRNRAFWALVGGLMPLLGLVVLCVINPLGEDGKSVGSCCPHCPCRGQNS